MTADNRLNYKFDRDVIRNLFLTRKSNKDKTEIKLWPVTKDNSFRYGSTSWYLSSISSFLLLTESARDIFFERNAVTASLYVSYTASWKFNKEVEIFSFSFSR